MGGTGWDAGESVADRRDRDAQQRDDAADARDALAGQRELVAEETDGFASMRDSLRTDLALDALALAIWRRQAQLQGLVHHPDRGSQYAGVEVRCVGDLDRRVDRRLKEGSSLGAGTGRQASVEVVGSPPRRSPRGSLCRG